MVEIGLIHLINAQPERLRGRRVGLVTHAAAVAPDLTHCSDLLRAHGVHITALFGPEHGLDGAGADATPIADAADARTGIPIYSLYGAHKQPSPAMLADVDVLVFDMQDIGARFYTFISTLDYVIRAAAEAGKEIIVLDRPNPLNGMQLEGALIDAGFESFIGQLAVPVRHGLTTGEIARLIVQTAQSDVALRVIPLRGWTRALWFDETGLPWIPLSPGMPTLEGAVVYPGTCLVEGTNLSEGRGTALPFRVVGAPWLNGEALARDLNRFELPGVRFRAHAFMPTDSKHRGVKCGGVQVHVTDRRIWQPVRMGVHLLAACRAQDPERFEFQSTSWEGSPPHLDLLLGSARVREGLSAGIPVPELVAEWSATEAEFRRTRAAILLYPENDSDNAS